jgi:hypothetical protein
MKPCNALLTFSSNHNCSLRRALLAAPLVLLCLALSQGAHAVSPPPDGAYPGWNTAEGSGALFNITSGTFNTGVGGHALYGGTSQIANTAVGAFALTADFPGNQNVAVGQGALGNNHASGNVAVGYKALFNNGLGSFSQAFGYEALFRQTIGRFNNGFGWHALYSNVTGENNTALGHEAGANITGERNTAIGSQALSGLTGADDNTAVGYSAGANVVSASHVICIGAAGEDVNDSCYIGNIYGALSLGGVSVFVNAAGKLGINPSSRQFKDDIKPMDKGSETILALEPVRFHYKSDTTKTPQFGLVAETVAEVNPDLVIYDANSKPYAVRYDAVNAMLLNEFLKEHKTVHAQGVIITQQRKDFEAAIAQQQKQIEALTATLKEQAAQIQKVTAQLETTRQVPQIVSNNQ